MVINYDYRKTDQDQEKMNFFWQWKYQPGSRLYNTNIAIAWGP